MCQPGSSPVDPADIYTHSSVIRPLLHPSSVHRPLTLLNDPALVFRSIHVLRSGILQTSDYSICKHGCTFSPHCQTPVPSVLLCKKSSHRLICTEELKLWAQGQILQKYSQAASGSMGCGSSQSSPTDPTAMLCDMCRYFLKSLLFYYF